MSAETDRCIAELTTLLGVASAQARKALDEHVNKVYTLSKYTYTPVDTAALRESAKNIVVQDTPTTYTRKISYGGESFALSTAVIGFHWGPIGAPEEASVFNRKGVQLGVEREVNYALAVHEKNVKHSHPPSARWKYLETASSELQHEIPKTMQEHIIL